MTVQNISAYTASKAAVRGLVKPLALELAPHGLRFTSLSPGSMMTDMMRGLQAKEPEWKSNMRRRRCLGG